MQDEPTPAELIKAVADFLRNEIAAGHKATTPSSSASASTRSSW